MRLSNGDCLLSWPLARHSLTVGNYYPGGSWHGAIDLAASVGSPVLAAEPGVIEWVQQWDGKTKSGNSAQTYGNAVRVRHDDHDGRSLQTLYAHLDAVQVSVGQRVAAGQQIALSGNTGASTGPHLHFEVRWGNKRYNPLCWLDDDFVITPGWHPYLYGHGEHAVYRPPDNAVPMVDISHHQQTLDADKLRAAGVQDVILRALHGAAGPDRYFADFARRADAAGLRTGAYDFCAWHFGRYNGGSLDKARALMRAETACFITQLAGQHITGWAALDQENEPSYNRMMALDRAGNTALLNEAGELLRRAGYAPCLYCSASWLTAHVDVDKLTLPIWAAYYAFDPADPDFADCPPLESLQSKHAQYLQGLGDRLIAWQYGRIGHGTKYGVASENIDRNWLYQQPEEGKTMKFETIEGLELVATPDKHSCEIFDRPDIYSPAGKLAAGTVLPIVARGAAVQVADMEGVWYRVMQDGKQMYVLALPDRCRVQAVPAPEQPVAPAPQPEDKPVPEVPAEPEQPAEGFGIRTVRVTLEVPITRLGELAELLM